MDLEAKLKQAFTDYNQWYNLENRLAEYEAFAWRVIGEAGYPAEWKALIEKLKSTPEPPREVRIAHDMFFSIKSVRNMLKKGRPDHVALEMMRLCNKGFNLNFVVIEPLVDKGVRYGKSQSKKAQKPRARDDMTPKDREKRNAAILAHFERLRHRLTVNAFDIKHAAKYGLKTGTIRKILTKRVGT